MKIYIIERRNDGEREGWGGVNNQVTCHFE